MSLWASMADLDRRKPIEELPKPDPVSIRTARNRFGALVDEVASGRCALVCRRSVPLAVLVPAWQYDQLVEVVRRDQSLAAILRASGIPIDTWNTAAALGAVARLVEERRG